MTGVLAAPVPAQDWKGRARVDGRVVGEDGAPVAGATVDARRVSREGGPRVTSDAGGRFAVDGIASGSWVVEVAAPGYSVRRIGVHLPSDSSWLGPVEVRLERSPPAPKAPDEPLRSTAAEAKGLQKDTPDTGAETAVDERAPAPTVGRADGPVGYEHVRAAIETGRVDRARQLLLAIEPGAFEDADTLFEIGLGFLNAGETREAVALFGRVLNRDPTRVDAHYRRAHGLLALGRHAEAREDLEAVLELQPDGALADKAGQALAQLSPGPAEEQ
jgi:hypothetical protein